MLAQIQTAIEKLTKQQRKLLLHDIIQNMAERNDAEEIASFVLRQLDGDAPEVVASYGNASLADRCEFVSLDKLSLDWLVG